MNIEIRNVKMNDLNNGLFKVFKEGYVYHQKGRPDIFSFFSDAELKEELIKIMENYLMLVLVIDGVICGYLTYSIIVKKIKKIYLEQFVIKESLRGKGYGKMLMNFLEKIGQENNCKKVELDCWMFNTNAQGMYEHLGYQKQRIIYEKNI